MMLNRKWDDDNGGKIVLFGRLYDQLYIRSDSRFSFSCCGRNQLVDLSSVLTVEHEKESPFIVCLLFRNQWSQRHNWWPLCLFRWLQGLNTTVKHSRSLSSQVHWMLRELNVELDVSLKRRRLRTFNCNLLPSLCFVRKTSIFSRSMTCSSIIFPRLKRHVNGPSCTRRYLNILGAFSIRWLVEVYFVYELTRKGFQVSIALGDLCKSRGAASNADSKCVCRFC